MFSPQNKKWKKLILTIWTLFLAIACYFSKKKLKKLISAYTQWIVRYEPTVFRIAQFWLLKIPKLNLTILFFFFKTELCFPIAFFFTQFWLFSQVQVNITQFGLFFTESQVYTGCFTSKFISQNYKIVRKSVNYEMEKVYFASVF